MKTLITIIAPMYNEEAMVYVYTETVLNILTQIEDKYDYEVLFVHDGSKDDTLLKMKEMQLKYPVYIGIVNLSRNFGLEGAVNAGLRTAKGDIIVVMDADLQDPPLLILDMIKKWENGADIVVASRVDRSKDNFFKRFSAYIYYYLLDSLSGKLKLEKNAANYRLLSRKAVNKLLELPEVNTYFRVNVPFIGMKTEKVEYSRDERAAGKTNYNFSSLVRCALDGLTSISIDPLRKIALTVPVSFLILLSSVIGIICSTGMWVMTWLILFTLSLFFSLLFICIAIISEYLGQILLEARHRPTSIILEYKPSENSIKR